MHVAQFIQRYPPALGGSEAYIAPAERVPRRARRRRDRVDDHRGGTGGDVAAGAGRTAAQRAEPPRRRVPPGVSSRPRYRPLRFPAPALHPQSALASPASPLAVPHDAVQPDLPRRCGATPAATPARSTRSTPRRSRTRSRSLCGLRLARRRGVPFLLTPFLHLGDPDDPHDRTRRQYTAAAPALAAAPGRPRVRADARSSATPCCRLGVPAERVVLQGLGVDPAECTGGDRDAARAAWGVAADEVVVGHLANNSVEKGTVDLLRAAERAWARGIDSASCWPGRRCRTSARSGTASPRRTASRGSAC